MQANPVLSLSRSLSVPLLLCAALAAPSHAMLLNGVEEFATLAAPVVATLRGRACTAPARTTVKVLGRPAGPGGPAAGAMLFVEVVEGRCKGYQLIIAASRATELRATPQREGR
ncbi:MAG: hypothetical protein V4857_13290 [Pseudomonadota bacterium]